MSRRPVPLPRRSQMGAIVLTAAVALTGCSSEAEPGAAPTPSTPPSGSPSPAAPAADEPADEGAAVSCEEALPVTALVELAEQPLDGPIDDSVSGLRACRWGSPDDVGVQVVTLPAEAWSRQLPAILEQAEASGLATSARERRKLEAAREALESGDVDGGRACDLFGVLLEIQGRPPGSRRIVNIVPTRENPQAVSAQTCTEGTYSSVLLIAPGLGGTEEEAARVSAALETVHAAGTGG